MPALHIAIAEDNRMALKAIEEKLSRFPDLDVRLKALNGKMLTEEIAAYQIDLILMDLDMPVINGIEATKEVKKRFPQIKVLVLTTFDDDEKIFDAIMAGASGYLLKEEPGDNIYRAIQETMDGGAAMSPIIAMKALNLIRTPLSPNTGKEDFGLTAREIELLEQLKNGLTYEQLATNLYISVGTVRKHIENVYRKLQVNNKVNAVKVATDNRLI
ncbi:MAG TPA: response regulator transcription factor [Chitinophagaceae bacterium]|nr:response regulator transcription factor [Chitinophagaceae bacterium]